MADFDAIIVGGGPAGSTCARFLVRGGARVAVVDRAPFPRVKLCGGWLSRAIWDELQIRSRDYPGHLWEWNTCHVSYQGQERAIRCRGWFIRRYELDDYLLRASGATLHLGVAVRDITRDDAGRWSVGGLSARHLIGAAGTHCPVARVLAPPRPRGPVGAQENEFRTDPAAIAQTRIGRDGEPELLLHRDLRGYSWNVPKTDWLNVGSGTVEPVEVRAAWQSARAHFMERGHVPSRASEDLEPGAMKGHAYFLYDPAHVGAAVRVDPDRRGGIYLVGDSLGLAHPLTAEGILPAVISGRLAAEAILAGAPDDYPARLAAHPVFADYRRLSRLTRVIAGRGGRRPAAETPRSSWPVRLAQRTLMQGFAWMFSGTRLPVPKIIDVALQGAERWLPRSAGHEPPL